MVFVATLSEVTHAETCAAFVQFMRTEACCPEEVGQLAVFVFFFISSKATGKAVKFGHSCAAVTHHSKPRPGGERPGKPIGSNSGEGEGGGRWLHCRQEMRSPNICPWVLTRSTWLVFAHVAREIFIAKMKRESSCPSGDGRGVCSCLNPKQTSMKLPSLSRLPGRFFVLLSALSTLPLARAQTPPEALDPLITTATRTPAAPRTIGTAVDYLSAEDLARRQITTLSQALGGIAGSPRFASGATGSITSLFLRGANSNQTLFLVDGVRFNDPNTDYQVFLGGACVAACDNLEVAHGPQSTLYGGEAVGGVVSLRAQRGSGPAAASVAVEGGSFGTVQGALSAQGQRGETSYNFSAQGGHTDNDRPNNSFDSANVTLRLDRTVTQQIAVGGTLRWFHGDYGDPGDRYTNDPDNGEVEDNVLATAFADTKFSPSWSSHAVLGGQDRRFVSTNPQPDGPTQITVVQNRRGVFDWQNTYTGLDRHRVTAGLTAEANHTRNTGFGNINKKQSLLAFFAQDEFSPVEDLYLTAGLRSDDYDTFGHATTGRVTAAWLVANRALKFRASGSTAFRSPSFLDLYGSSAFYVGNPNLRPEKAHGWDAGVDYYLPQKRGTLSATWFETSYRDLITFDFSAFPGTVVNIERARTRGLELTAQSSLPGVVEARIAYTYLEADNLTQNIRLLRRPRHSLSADVWHEFGAGVSVGAGLVFAADRRDVDAATFETIDAEDYTVVRVYGAWKINDRLTLKARVENLLNERYEEVNGYPALGLGVFASATWKF
jgi:vitamin B12 transporter